MSRDIIKKCNKIYPWFAGLSADLLFFVAIDSLWLSVVKGLNPAQIVSLTTISLIVCIVLQTPILKIIHKIGNTKSTRLGTWLLLGSSILLTFGTSYPWLVAGKIVFEMSLSFKNMESALLKNNLSMLHEGDESFIRIKNQANTVYSVITAVIAFLVAYIFNYNHYLPMYLCIFFCVVSAAMCFLVRDFSENSKRKHIHEKNQKPDLNAFLITAIISYSIFYPLLDGGQNNGKLFIQQDMLQFFIVSKTARYLTLIVAISRIVRIISNLTFSKIYAKLKDIVVVFLSIGLTLSLFLMLLGFYIPAETHIKFTIMGCGYVILLAIRDPFKTYLQDLVLSHTAQSNQQAALIYMEMARKIFAATFNISLTFLLLKVDLVWAMILTFILSSFEIMVCIKLYSIVRK